MREKGLSCCRTPSVSLRSTSPPDRGVIPTETQSGEKISSFASPLRGFSSGNPLRGFSFVSPLRGGFGGLPSSASKSVVTSQTPSVSLRSTSPPDRGVIRGETPSGEKTSSSGNSFSGNPLRGFSSGIRLRRFFS